MQKINYQKWYNNDEKIQIIFDELRIEINGKDLFNTTCLI